MVLRNSDTHIKVDQPHKVYASAEEVASDPTLTDDEKEEALRSLEQDAKQLATASAEGMTGGEETRLREVLMVKDELHENEGQQALGQAAKLLDTVLKYAEGSEAHPLILEAMEGLNRARAAMKQAASARTPPAGAPRPGSKAELEEELAKEQLDP